MTTFMTYKEERDVLRQQLAEKDGEIEHLDRTKAEWKNTAKLLDEKLAASQAREVQLREALEYHRDVHCTNIQAYKLRDEALTLPQDTTALEAMIAEAGEVMRERCSEMAMYEMAIEDCVISSEAIRVIRGVTLEDLGK